MLARDYEHVGSVASLVAQWDTSETVGRLKSIGDDHDDGRITISDATHHNVHVRKNTPRFTQQQETKASDKARWHQPTVHSYTR